MKQWRYAYSHNYHGELDSEGNPHGFGVYVWNEKEYYLGQWKNDFRHGWGIAKYDNGNFRVGLNKNDNVAYPSILFTNDNIAYLEFGQTEDGKIKQLLLWMNDGSWRYSLRENDENIGHAIEYDAVDGAILMLNYPGNNADVDVNIELPIKFPTSKPIINKEKLLLPLIPDIHNFKFESGTNSTGDNYQACSNLSNSATGEGLGVVSWRDDATFSFGRWAYNSREGLNLYREENVVSVEFEKEGEPQGICFNFFVSKNDPTFIEEISIKLRSEDGTESDIICIIGDEVTFSPAIKATSQRDGKGLLMKDTDSIKCIRFNDGRPQYDEVSWSYKLVGKEIVNLLDDDYRDPQNKEEPMIDGLIKYISSLEKKDTYVVAKKCLEDLKKTQLSEEDLDDIVKLAVSCDGRCSAKEKNAYNAIFSKNLTYDEFFELTNHGREQVFFDQTLELINDKVPVSYIHDLSIILLAIFHADGTINESEIQLLKRIVGE